MIADRTWFSKPGLVRYGFVAEAEQC